MNPTKEQYEAAKAKCDASEKVWQEHNKDRKRGQMWSIPEGHDPATNEDRATVEVYEFMHMDKGKDGYFCYWKQRGGDGYVARLTTWTDDTLGFVTNISIYNSPGFNRSQSKRVCFRAMCLDGHYYTGIYYASAGGYCRMRRLKERSKAWYAAKKAAQQVHLGPGEAAI